MWELNELKVREVYDLLDICVDGMTVTQEDNVIDADQEYYDKMFGRG